MCKFRNYDKYEVYPDGHIWSYSHKKFLKPQTNPNGYQQVQLSENEGIRKTYLVHRVVWEAVNGSPIPNNLQINHRNEIKTSNMITNLELVSPKENINYGTGISRRAKSQTNNQKTPKAVLAFKDGELVMTFPSTAEAGRQGFNEGAVAACCRGERKTHKGYTWKYLN